MSERLNYSSGAQWENVVGYSRAVQVGDVLEVAGTVAADEKGVVGKGSFYEQTKFIIQKIEKVLITAGFSLKDVVRTRLFVTDIKHWEEVGKAHGEFFKDIKPASSMLQISALIDPDYLVEIEVTAIRPKQELIDGVIERARLDARGAKK
jgi:enamine deaminase RidA (YjgF/YER057c/UK114 family)